MPNIEEQRAAAMAAHAAKVKDAPPGPRILKVNITPELAAAMAKFQSDLPRIEKNRRVDVETKGDKDNYGYDYATLEHVSHQVLPRLGALGLAFISFPDTGPDGRPVLSYYLTHESGGYIAAEFPLKWEGKYQQLGSAITYMRRYAVQGVTGVAAPESDDDGAAADAETAPRVAARRSRAAQAERNVATKRAGTTAQRRAQSDAPVSPAAGDGPAEDNTGQNEGFSAPRNPDAPISGPQAQKIAMQFGDLGRQDNSFTDRGKRLTVVGSLVGRQVGSLKDLNMGEAHELINIIDSALATENPIQVLRDVAQDLANRQAEASQTGSPE